MSTFESSKESNVIEVIEDPRALVHHDDWQDLKQFTHARIALGRVGTSLPTHAQLAFQLDHALARDAVHYQMNFTQFKQELSQLNYDLLTVKSAAKDRVTYLQRPDLGRKLSEQSKLELESFIANNNQTFDLLIVVGDGLSPLAIEKRTQAFLKVFLPLVELKGFKIAPIVIAEQARVALGDEIASIFKAKMVVILIGERPGLSSPDSLGIYMTYEPKVGNLDSGRNCISNVRPEGLPDEQAAFKLYYLLCNAFEKQLSGVQLKDESIHSFAKIT
jgi:ethanolamine ammonia-lyase small subunit